MNDTGLEVQFDPSTSQEERQAFMRQPTRPGTRMLSNLEGKNERLGFGRSQSVEEDPLRRKLQEMATDTRFPRNAEAGLKGFEMLNDLDTTNRAFNENQRQFDVTSGMTRSQNEMENQFKERELGIDQQQTNADAMYKKYLAENQGNKNALNTNQWIAKNKDYFDSYSKMFDDDATFQTDPRNYLDAEGQQRMDHRTLLYRDDPWAAMELYGEPDRETKAKVSLNMNPIKWQEYINATPEQQAALLNGIIQRQG
jgi:hypothetical protein